MYDAASDTPATARTSNLNEELGQVKFLMTDKTGTLTRNIMTFKRCSVGRVNYGNDEDEVFSDPTILEHLNNNSVGFFLVSRTFQGADIYEFFLAMAVCHTVVPEVDTATGEVIYQASSPDEGALVKGACSQGFVFRKRTPDSVTVDAVSRRHSRDCF